MARSEKIDQTLFCDHCGISFLWSQEEQNPPTLEQVVDSEESEESEEVDMADTQTLSSFLDISRKKNTTTVKKPAHCPGCRHLLPADERERGLVKWYNPQKQFGFITRANAPEIFAHRTQIRSKGSGQRRMKPGVLVEFRPDENNKGPYAADIHILES
ncbi:MAG: cold shock domain-containing protein [Chloroflexota bacterium]